MNVEVEESDNLVLGAFGLLTGSLGYQSGTPGEFPHVEPTEPFVYDVELRDAFGILIPEEFWVGATYKALVEAVEALGNQGINRNPKNG